jgi:hypothetical protein
MVKLRSECGKDTHLSDNLEHQPLLVVAILTIMPGTFDQFREFETRAARILARHGGFLWREP